MSQNGGHDQRCELRIGGWTYCFCLPRAAAVLGAVSDLVEHAKAVSPSDRMTVYVGDLEHALGRRTERARTRTGSGNG